MIQVVNKYKHTPTRDDIYIGRGSPLGNPYTSISEKSTKADVICSSREESIEMFEKYLLESIEFEDEDICRELNQIWLKAKKGNVNLVCFCKPKDCHGDIIKKIVEEKLVRK